MSTSDWKEACEEFKQELADMKWEYENACKFATDFEQQRDKLKAEIVNREGEKQEMREVIDRLKADYTQLSARMDEYLADYKKLNDASIQTHIDLEREREANAKLREALEAIASDRWILGECQIDDFKGLDEKSIAKQALLAAKQDEGKE